MEMLSFLVFLCLPAACILGVSAIAWLGYGGVKAGFNIGRCGFYIEAGTPDCERRRAGISNRSRVEPPGEDDGGPTTGPRLG